LQFYEEIFKNVVGRWSFVAGENHDGDARRGSLRTTFANDQRLMTGDGRSMTNDQ
jgi:hypothetical protein